ncbi:hypothetical protein CDAR_187611 [Caerostris darwini]|uniref:Uncharacterized protein n=1 Tax=Caerostris darwini TaxID=1538125 RepID=A0AAV4V7D6_9ARAC|nr:hypothetical protein CDAR_187611 [Caerostris darwini]
MSSRNCDYHNISERAPSTVLAAYLLPELRFSDLISKKTSILIADFPSPSDYLRKQTVLPQYFYCASNTTPCSCPASSERRFYDDRFVLSPAC